MSEVTAKSEYTRLCTRRDWFLERARQASLLTLPGLIPEEGVEESGGHLPAPYQSMGAHGCNNLSAAITLSVLPASEAFFKFELDAEVESALAEEMGGGQVTPKVKEAVAELSLTLSLMERRVLKKFEELKYRPVIGETNKHLLVAGNCVHDFGVNPEDQLRLIRLDNYVINRDGEGNPTLIVTRERIHLPSAPEELRNLLGGMTSDTRDVDEDTAFLYSALMADGKGTYSFWQELEGVEIPDTLIEDLTYEESPLQAYWLYPNHGQDYSYSYVDHYIGDLKTLEGLSEAIVDMALAAARTFTTVDPAGLTDKDTIAGAENGDVVDGREQDIYVSRSDKSGDFRLVDAAINRIEQRLARAFLLTEGVMRDAERVTAEEIRVLIQSLQKQLGNIYSTISQEMQLPLLKRVVNLMEKENELPKLPDTVDFVIVTGVDALGRNQELERIQTYLEVLQRYGGDKALMATNVHGLSTVLAENLHLDRDKFVKTPEQMAQEAEQARQDAMVERATGPVAAAVAAGAAQNQPEPNQ